MHKMHFLIPHQSTHSDYYTNQYLLHDLMVLIIRCTKNQYTFLLEGKSVFLSIDKND